MRMFPAVRDSGVIMELEDAAAEEKFPDGDGFVWLLVLLLLFL